MTGARESRSQGVYGVWESIEFQESTESSGSPRSPRAVESMESWGSESVLGTFVLDSPSKVPFTSVLMAQLCVASAGSSADQSWSGWRSRLGGQGSEGASASAAVWLGQWRRERKRRLRLGEPLSSWLSSLKPWNSSDEMPPEIPESLGESAEPQEQGSPGSLWSESVLGTFVLDSPSKVPFTSVLMAQLCCQPARRRLVQVWAAQGVRAYRLQPQSSRTGERERKAAAP